MPDEITDTDMNPSDSTTESKNRSGEEVIEQEGSEPGRSPNQGTQGESERPYGTSDARSATGVAPGQSTPKDSDMPNMQPGDAGG